MFPRLTPRRSQYITESAAEVNKQPGCHVTGGVAGSQLATTCPFLQEVSAVLLVCLHTRGELKRSTLVNALMSYGLFCSSSKNNKRRRCNAHFSRRASCGVCSREVCAWVTYPILPLGPSTVAPAPHQPDEGSNSRALVWTFIPSFTGLTGLRSRRLKSPTHTHRKSHTGCLTLW